MLEILKQLNESPAYTPPEKVIIMAFALDPSPKSHRELMAATGGIPIPQIEYACDRVLRREGLLRLDNSIDKYLRGNNPVWAAIDQAAAPQAAADLEVKTQSTSRKREGKITND